MFCRLRPLPFVLCVPSHNFYELHFFTILNDISQSLTERFIKQKADFLLINGKIWTADYDQPWAEAFAVSDGKFIAVGKNSEIKNLISDKTEVLDAEGKLVIPGFIDSHLHFIEGGFRLSSVQLRSAKTKDEFIKRIKKFAEGISNDEWIKGGDWDHTNWGGELPDKSWIDSFTENIPVWVNRLDAHMALANSLALNIANITKDTKDVEGGTIMRNRTGEPTGILKDNAMRLIEKILPEPSFETKAKGVKAAQKYTAKLGITSVHHMGTWDDLATFEKLEKENKLKTRIYAAVPISTWKKLAEKTAEGFGSDRLKFGALKGFMDGSLGSHTAALLEPYENDNANSGLFVTSPDEMLEWAKCGDKNNLQILIHAIGDRAVRELLNISESIERENGKKERRFRIEHAQHIEKSDVPRFADLNVIASMQPVHLVDDGRWAERAIGKERIKSSYRIKSLLEKNVKVSLGSDWFIADPSPLQGIYSAVTRRTNDGKNPEGWIPSEKISIEQALRGYTIDAAYASFDEKIKGSITTGKLADFVILEKNIFNDSVEELPEIKIVKTVIGGEEVFIY